MPRIRFNTQTLLLTTAILAADCAVLRYLYTSDTLSRKVDLFPRASPGQVAGFLPVLHFALLGLACFITQRRFRKFRHGTERTVGRPPAGTYFCVHFLALGCILARIAPDVIEAYTYRVTMVTEPVLRLAEPFLVPALDGIDDPFSVFLLQCFVEALLISGPLLVFAVVGHVLANRAAQALPRYRFTMLAFLVSFGFALIGLSVCLTPRPIDDDPPVDFKFHVVDRETDRPIDAALVRIVDAFSSGPPTGPTGLTNRAGDARLTGRFPATGERNAFVAMGSCSLWGHWLEVSGANYRTTRVPLSAVMGEVVDLAGVHVGKVALIRGETPTLAFRDIAGRYSNSIGYGGGTFEFTVDGRFCWIASGCMGVTGQDYGHIRSQNGEIELISIHRRGYEASPFTIARYRVIKWDDRRYLCFATDECLHEFCRASLRLNGSRTFGYVSSAYREFEANEKPRPLRGFPELAGTVWLSFIQSELDLHNRKGGLRRVVDALNPWRRKDGREPALAL